MTKEVHFSITIAIVLLTVSCGNKKAIPATDVYTQEQVTALQEYPKLNGYMPHIITVPQKENESLLKVQIVPGKTMEIDCNKHGLQGKYERKMLNNSETYFVFLSKGEVFSTMMGCPDNSKRQAFVSGPTIFTHYNSKSPFVVYTPNGIDLKYRIWQASEMHAVGKTIDKSAQNETTEDLNAFPENKKGYDRYVLLLPKLSNTQKQVKELKIELIPGITKKVDCNTHRLMGKFSTEIVEGYGYEYLVFNSDGKYTSTRIGCPEKELTSKFIYGETQTISYNSEIPIAIFVPQGFEVKYRVWESPAMNL